MVPSLSVNRALVVARLGAPEQHSVLRLEVRARIQRTSLTRVIEEGLRLRLRSQAAPQRGKLRLPVFKGRGGLAAGVDPLSNKAMLSAVGDDA